MDAAALGDVDDLDFDLGFMDGFEGFDFDFDLLDMDLAEFCAGEGKGERLLPAVADKEGGLRLDLGSRDGEGDGGEGGRESSPDSVVTDDGAPSLSSADREDGEMSAYVTDLERFLLEDDDEAGGLLAKKEEFAADDHFFGDIDDGYAEPATPGKDLVIDDYFLGGYIEPSTAGEDPVSDDYFYDEAAANGSVDDAASAAAEDYAAAREHDDEATSRKRARQRKATAVKRNKAELRERPMMHPISSISTGGGCRPLGHHWLLRPCTTVCLLA